MRGKKKKVPTPTRSTKRAKRTDSCPEEEEEEGGREEEPSEAMEETEQM